MSATANQDIAATFDEIADLLSLQDANPFRIRAYRNAARVVGGLQTDLASLIAAGKPVPKLPGIGADLAAKIGEIVATGHSELLERLRLEVPPSVADLLHVPGLGPKKARALYQELHVQSLPQLLRAAKDKRIEAVAGFGTRTQQHLIDVLESRLSEVKRYKLAAAYNVAVSLVDYLGKNRGIKEVLIAGSLRRARDTVGDIDLLAVAKDGKTACEYFARYPNVRERLSVGDKRASVVLKNGMQVDLRVVDQLSAGAALLYFTGSKAHNIALRNLALARGCKLNEYGLFRGRQRVAGETEQSVYEALGLPWIAPELRENRGEIEAARDGRLPKLIRLSDLLGDLHVHSDWSDGVATIQEMATAAAKHGLQYIAICDHSRRLAVAHGLDAKRLGQQREEIGRIEQTHQTPIAILCGIEVDILPDGSLDLPPEALAPLDIVVAAVHSSFTLARARQTERILRALDLPIDVLAHPLGRLIDEREPYDVDMAAVIRKCATQQVALELNAHPERLDLLDTWCRAARDAGVPIAINSDSHSPADFDNLQFGVGQARRGWLEKDNVLNAKDLSQVRRWLQRRSRRWPALAPGGPASDLPTPAKARGARPRSIRGAPRSAPASRG
ncbi:MAG TPA: DNA polymerase/3'-5' exonuclease PolX [Burkholderiaceae bacterium]|nr:DNA polymerase/3'-5' exonuclease PolX [Burkholderiaceae bacterium]